MKDMLNHHWPSMISRHDLGLLGKKKRCLSIESCNIMVSVVYDMHQQNSAQHKTCGMNQHVAVLKHSKSTIQLKWDICMTQGFTNSTRFGNRLQQLALTILSIKVSVVKLSVKKKKKGT